MRQNTHPRARAVDVRIREYDAEVDERRRRRRRVQTAGSERIFAQASSTVFVDDDGENCDRAAHSLDRRLQAV